MKFRSARRGLNTSLLQLHLKLWIHEPDKERSRGYLYLAFAATNECNTTTPLYGFVKQWGFKISIARFTDAKVADTNQK